MKIKSLLLVAAGLLCSLLPSSAKANCFTPEYSSYITRSVTSANQNPDPSQPGASYTAYQTVTVTGTTVFGAGCDIMEFSTYHTPHIKNIIGSVGGLTTGQPIIAGGYIDYSTTVSKTYTGSLVGVDDTDETDDNVFCPLANYNIFDSGDNLLAFEIAYTKSTNTQSIITTNCKYPDGTGCTVWSIVNYCSASTTPPDYKPNTYTAPSYYTGSQVYFIYGIAACLRVNISGYPWICTPGPNPSISFPKSSPPPISSPGSCTSNL